MADVSSFLSQLSFSDFSTLVTPLVFVVIGMSIYALYVYTFYQALSKKDIFPLNLRRHSKRFTGILKNISGVLLYVAEYLVLFPLFALFWFAVISVFLIFLSNNPIHNILLLAMGLVATIRVAAYYNEELSKDLAKLVPFVLLAVFLTDLSQFSLVKSLTAIMQIPLFWKEIIYYFLFVVALEFVLRMGHALFRVFVPEQKEETKEAM